MCGVRSARLTLLNFTTTTERGLLEPRSGPGSTDILRVTAEFGPGSNDTNKTLYKTFPVFSVQSFSKN